MNILYHHRTQSQDAQGIHIGEMISAFRSLGHDVVIVAMADKTGVRSQGRITRVLGWLAHRVPAWFYELMGLLYNCYGYYQICRAIRVKRPDFIYERYALNTYCGIWASRRFGIPLVLEVNAPLFHEQSKLGRLWFARIAKFSERWICANSTWTVVVSQIMKDMLIRDGVPDSKIVVMPNGIDPKRFHPGISGQRIRSRYKLDGKVVLGFVGWFRPWHGLEMLLEIVRDASWNKSEVHLLLVGEGPVFAHLVRYATCHSLLSAVTFVGPVDHQDIPEYIAAMDIAVQPSATEYACPMKILEYLGMAKCIVAPDQPNIREIVAQDETAYLFRPGDKQDLLRVLQHAVRNPSERARMASAAWRSVQERGFHWEANAKKVLSLVGAAIGSSSSSHVLLDGTSRDSGRPH